MRALSLALATLALAACDKSGDSLEIVGSYTDGFGGTHDITETTWTQGGFGEPSVFHIASFDNEAGNVIAENDAANEFSAGLWSRFDWTEVDGALWFCQSAFDAADQAAAEAATPADPAGLETDGCGGFAWSELTPAE
jgi:hypothetical protein